MTDKQIVFPWVSRDQTASIKVTRFFCSCCYLNRFNSITHIKFGLVSDCLRRRKNWPISANCPISGWYIWGELIAQDPPTFSRKSQEVCLFVFRSNKIDSFVCCVSKTKKSFFLKVNKIKKIETWFDGGTCRCATACMCWWTRASSSFPESFRWWKNNLATFNHLLFTFSARFPYQQSLGGFFIIWKPNPHKIFKISKSFD